MDPGKPSTSTLKQNIYTNKVMLSIWWDINGVMHYELLDPGQTVTADIYQKQLIRFRDALKILHWQWKSASDSTSGQCSTTCFKRDSRCYL